MNYLIFTGAIALTAGAALFTYYAGVMLLLAPTALLKKNSSSFRIAALPFWLLTGLFQAGFWGLWAALCVAIILKFTQVPGVQAQWLYWFTGFLSCVVLIGLITYENIRGGRSIAGIRGIQNGWTLFSLVAVMAFSAFSYKPSYGIQTYGFVLKPLGLEKYLVSKPKASSLQAHAAAEAGKVSDLHTILNFFEGYDYLVRASKSLRLPDPYQVPLNDMEKVTQLLIESKARLSGCDVDLLNGIYRRWGDLVIRNLIPSIDWHLSDMGITRNADAILTGDRLMADFDEWMGQNWSSIALILNKHYGL